ncbi:MAG: TRAP transporter, DctM subunit [Candidatus Accumulibacter phosphatis]|uniref:TRAP transporter, DctM subunit n=2 Tax=Candidatus Accumulibacter TaxID=327159 RepID=A0A084Y6H7_9PROT|nr:MAG: TRAP transporter, DctM subunit [Candidatus Accumulibacter phosphatis]
MQTSFMHPPFGFALFYLRSVAPASVKTTDIYWGAIPFVCIQIIMVGILIFFPQLVTFGLDQEEKVDLDSVQIEMPTSDYGAPSTPPGFESPKEASPAASEDAASKAVRDAMKQDQTK